MNPSEVTILRRWFRPDPEIRSVRYLPRPAQFNLQLRPKRNWNSSLIGWFFFFKKISRSNTKWRQFWTFDGSSLEKELTGSPSIRFREFVEICKLTLFVIDAFCEENGRGCLNLFRFCELRNRINVLFWGLCVIKTSGNKTSFRPSCSAEAIFWAPRKIFCK